MVDVPPFYKKTEMVDLRPLKKGSQDRPFQFFMSGTLIWGINSIFESEESLSKPVFTANSNLYAKRLVLFQIRVSEVKKLAKN